MYHVLHRDKLLIPIHMQLSQKQKKFSQFFSAFLKSRLNFEYFEKKKTLITFVFPALGSLKMWLNKCLKIPASQDRLTSNIINVPKHSWDPYHRPFIIFINHCQGNWFGKSLSYWHAKSWDCLLTHWLPMKSILFFIGTIYWYQFRCKYLRNKKVLLNFVFLFWNLD